MVGTTVPISSTPNPFILAHLPAKRLSLLSLQLRLAFLWPMRGNRTPPRGFWERFFFPVKRKEIHKETTHCRASMCFLPLDRSCEVMRHEAAAPTGTTFSTQTSFLFWTNTEAAYSQTECNVKNDCPTGWVFCYLQLNTFLTDTKFAFVSEYEVCIIVHLPVFLGGFFGQS